MKTTKTRTRKTRLARASLIAVAFGALGLAGKAVTANPTSRGRLAEPPAFAEASPAHDALELVYEVFHHDGERTKFLATPAGKSLPSRLLFEVDHAAGYPPRASLDPSGARVAMTRLPPGARRNDPAELVVVDLASGARQVLDSGAHYFTRPVFVDGALVFTRERLAPEPENEPEPGNEPFKPSRVREVEVEVLRADLGTGLLTRIHAETLIDLFLVGRASPSGEVVAVRRTPGEAEVVSLDPRTGAMRALARTAPGVELRRAALSSDGASLVLDELVLGASNAELSRVPSSGGARARLGLVPAEEPSALLAPDFFVRPRDGELVLEADPSAPRPKVRALRPASAAKVTVPMALSPEGRFAVTRSLVGPTQVYRIVDARTGGSRPLPPSPGGDLFGMNAEVVGFAPRTP